MDMEVAESRENKEPVDELTGEINNEELEAVVQEGENETGDQINGTGDQIDETESHGCETPIPGVEIEHGGLERDNQATEIENQGIELENQGDYTERQEVEDLPTFDDTGSAGDSLSDYDDLNTEG